MAVKQLSTIIYDQLCEVNIMKFGHLYSIPLAIKSFWYYKQVIDCDQILSNRNESEAKDLIQVIKMCTNLKKLILNDKCTNKILQDILTTVASHCPYIIHLHLDGKLMKKKHILALCQCTTLEELSLWCVADDATFETIFSSLPNLRYFKVKAQKFLVSESTSHLIQLPRNLEVLQVSHSFTKGTDYNDVRTYFTQCRKAEVGFISSLSSVAPYLTYLSLDMYLDNLNIFKEMKQLRTLLLNFAFLIDDNDIKIITENCTLLVELTLYQFSHLLTKQSFDYIGNLPELKKLSIGGQYFLYSTLYNTCMSGLSNCVKLETLKVQYCGLTNYAAVEIAQKCQYLSRFTIVDCKVTANLYSEIATEIQKPKIGRISKLNVTVYNAEIKTSPPSENSSPDRQHDPLPKTEEQNNLSSLCVMRVRTDWDDFRVRPRFIELQFGTSNL